MGAAREDVERMIAEELRSHHQATGAWVKAMAESQGDFDRARDRYRKLRLAELCAARQGDGLQQLRTELRFELARHDKASAYSVLGLSPDVTEKEIAAAIAGLIMRGETLDAGARYAVEVLGDQTRRAEYDRQLLGQLRVAKPQHHAAPAVEQRAVPRTAVVARRSARDAWLALGAVAAIGLYFGTEYYREMRQQEIEREWAARQAAFKALHRAASPVRDESRINPSSPIAPAVQAGM